MSLCISLVIRSKIARRTIPAPVLKGKSYHHQDYDKDNIDHREVPLSLRKRSQYIKIYKTQQESKGKGEIALKKPGLSSIMILE
jgi:hypothetical protein